MVEAPAIATFVPAIVYATVVIHSLSTFAFSSLNIEKLSVTHFDYCLRKIWRPHSEILVLRRKTKHPVVTNNLRQPTDLPTRISGLASDRVFILDLASVFLLYSDSFTLRSYDSSCSFWFTPLGSYVLVRACFCLPLVCDRISIGPHN